MEKCPSNPPSCSRRSSLSRSLRRVLCRACQCATVVVGPLALGVGVMDDETEARTGTGCRPLQHLVIAIGITERCERPSANVHLDADWLAFFVIHEVDLRQLHERGPR